MEKIKKKRRIATIRTVIISFAVAAVLCSLFAVCFRKYMVSVVKERCMEALDYNETSIQSLLNPERVTGQEITLTDFRCILTRYAYYRISIPLSSDNYSTPELTSGYSEGCHAYTFAWDEEGNRVAASSLSLHAYLKLGGDPADNGNYVCDKQDNVPEIKRLYDDYSQLVAGRKDSLYSISLKMESAYVDREKRTFIPAKGRIVLSKDVSSEGASLSDIVEVESREVNITVDDETYEFVEFRKQGDEYPREPYLLNFFGEEPELVEKAYRDDVPEDGMRPISIKEDARVADGIIRARRTFRMYVDHEPYDVCLLYVVDCHAGEFVKYYRQHVIPVCLAVLALAALICWRKLVSNKANYAMEDYRRDLTNHLAHDIKTPLMAIGGYAENIKEVNLMEEEKQHYLDAILENVSFTDSMINRTLYLNSMEDRSVGKPETIAVETVVADLLKKYEPLLEKNGIRCNVEGSATVKADRTVFETIVENLVSNAVKYTPGDGTISAKVDQTGLMIVNTVAEKVEVKNLTTPFVRGDQSRSNHDGSGLGLALAERAASMSGFSLKLLCSDDDFTAKLRF